jgi:UDP-N-acetyl-D-galactosamine dehydrogenase
MTFDIDKLRIGVIGLGYVGLPLAVEFGRRFPTVGFDINDARIAELEAGKDSTLEVTPEELADVNQLSYTSDIAVLSDCNFYIVTVPTPISRSKRPVLTPLRLASEMLSSVLNKGDIVVYESTVYPGATEEFCVPYLEQGSGLKLNKDFFVRLPTILKVTSGSTPEAADFIDSVYALVVAAGTHKTSSIKVAEAAKVIENTQRDVNIALVNELAMIFERMDIDTEEVLIAAGTKWNFLPFRPGLVGGHCIGVDPYYLTYKAEQLGYHPQMILAGRRINDNMGQYVASQVPKSARVLVLGLTFKENCPDLRNTRVVDIVSELTSYGSTVDVHDPWVNPQEARAEFDIDLVADPEAGAYDTILIAVGHRQFTDLGEAGIRRFGKPTSLVYDIKYVLPQGAADDRL